MNSKKSLLSGLLLLAMPSLFFVSVVLEVVFNNNYLIENIFVPLDRISNLLSILLIYIFPLAAFVINFFPFVKVKFKSENENFICDFTFRKNALNYVVALAGFLFVSAVSVYLITENFISIK